MLIQSNIMADKHYKRLDEEHIDAIDSAIFNGDIFFNIENIIEFRYIMARWEKELHVWEERIKECENDNL